MGGYGSSRWGWHTKKTTVEDCLAFALSDLLAGAAWGGLTWKWGERETSSISYQVERSDSGQPWRVVLSYRLKANGEDIREPIAITQTLTPWGSRRYWFVCPLVIDGQACGRRARKLYLPPGGRYFGCRHCYRLSYQARQEYRPLAFLASILTPDLMADYPGMTPAEVARMVDAGLSGRKLPADLKQKAYKAFLIRHAGELAGSDPYEGYLTAGDLCQRAGLGAAELAALESARLLVPDRENRYRPKLAGWAGKLAYLLREGWEIAEIKRWAAGRWDSPDPRRWPPERAAWRVNESERF